MKPVLLIRVINTALLSITIATGSSGCRDKFVNEQASVLEETVDEDTVDEDTVDWRESFRRVRKLSGEHRLLEALVEIQSVEHARRDLLRDNPDYIIAYHKAFVLQRLGRRNEAQEILETQAGYMEGMLTDSSESYDPELHALFLMGLGANALDEGDHVVSKQYLERALELASGSGQKHSATIVTILTKLAMVAYHQGELEYSLELLTRAQTRIATSSLVLFEYPVEIVSAVYHNQGVTYFALGDYQQAIAALESSLEKLDQVNGRHLGKAITTLTILADVYCDAGHPEVGLRYLERAEKLYREFLADGGVLSTDLLNVLVNQSKLLLRRGQSEKALKLCLQALECLHANATTIGGLEFLDRYVALLTLEASCYYYQGRYGKSQQRLRDAISQLKANPATKLLSITEADVLNNLAMVCLQCRDLDAAAKTIQEALQFDGRVQNLTNNHVTSFHNAGLISTARGEFELAREYFESAISAAQEVFPPEVCANGSIVEELSRLKLGVMEIQAGDSQQGTSLIRSAADRMYRLLHDQLWRGSEAEAMSRLAHTVSCVDALLAAGRHGSLSDEESLEHVRRHKSLLLRTFGRRFALMRRLAPEWQPLYQEYLGVRRRLADHSAGSVFGTADPETDRDALSARKESLERELSPILGRMRQVLEDDLPAVSELQQSLRPGDACIEWVRYKDVCSGDPKVVSYYAAFIVTRETVERLDFNALQLERTIERWITRIGQGKVGPTVKQAVVNTLWEPIEQRLAAKTRRIFICPDGKVGWVPWSAIPWHDGKGRESVLLNRYSISLCPSSDVLRKRRTDDQQGNSPVLLVGDVDYGAARAAPEPRRPEPPTGPWAPLQHTRQEVEHIRECLGSREFTLLMGRHADSDTVSAALADVRVAHFATHGFAMSGQVGGYSMIIDKFASQAVPLPQDPLVFSGLVLSGANRQEAASRQSTYLSGETIASLPLENLELAVLSACDSGRGPIALGEGIFGLQRAFHMAGTRNVVSSLWRVDDRATAVLMGLFYHYLWEEELPPDEALRQAQLRVYERPGVIDDWAPERGPPVLTKADPQAESESRRGPDVHVRLWAGFVLSGPGD